MVLRVEKINMYKIFKTVPGTLLKKLKNVGIQQVSKTGWVGLMFLSIEDPDARGKFPFL